MYLSSKQLAFLIVPFAISFAIYIYSSEIASYISNFFPVQKKYLNMDIDAKIDTYLQIEREKKTYEDILQKVGAREESTKWIVDNLFFEKQQSQDIKEGKIVEAYKLQALFYDTKTAIINNIIVKEGSVIGESVVTKIEKNRVQIKTQKGLKWLTIFH